MPDEELLDELDELLEELEELEELLELLLEELDELLELLLDELEELLVVDDPEPLPTQVGSTKLPSWLPWKPKLVVCPGAKLPFQPILLAFTVLPLVLTSAFQLPLTCGASLKFRAICQPLTGEVPLLVTAIFNT